MVTPITSDVPTPKDVVSRARAMIPTLIDRAPKQQAHRRILDETIADLKAAGFFKILQPKRWGGWEMQPRTFFEHQLNVLALGNLDARVMPPRFERITPRLDLKCPRTCRVCRHDCFVAIGTGGDESHRCPWAGAAR